MLGRNRQTFGTASTAMQPNDLAVTSSAHSKPLLAARRGNAPSSIYNARRPNPMHNVQSPPHFPVSRPHPSSFISQRPLGPPGNFQGPRFGIPVGIAMTRMPFQDGQLDLGSYAMHPTNHMHHNSSPQIKNNPTNNHSNDPINWVDSLQQHEGTVRPKIDRDHCRNLTWNPPSNATALHCIRPGLNIANEQYGGFKDMFGKETNSESLQKPEEYIPEYRPDCLSIKGTKSKEKKKKVKKQKKSQKTVASPVIQKPNLDWLYKPDLPVVDKGIFSSVSKIPSISTEGKAELNLLAKDAERIKQTAVYIGKKPVNHICTNPIKPLQKSNDVLPSIPKKLDFPNYSKSKIENESLENSSDEDEFLTQLTANISMDLNCERTQLPSTSTLGNEKDCHIMKTLERKTSLGTSDFTMVETSDSSDDEIERKVIEKVYGSGPMTLQDSNTDLNFKDVEQPDKNVHLASPAFEYDECLKEEIPDEEKDKVTFKGANFHSHIHSNENTVKEETFPDKNLNIEAPTQDLKENITSLNNTLPDLPKISTEKSNLKSYKKVFEQMSDNKADSLTLKEENMKKVSMDSTNGQNLTDKQLNKECLNANEALDNEEKQSFAILKNVHSQESDICKHQINSSCDTAKELPAVDTISNIKELKSVGENSTETGNENNTLVVDNFGMTSELLSKYQQKPDFAAIESERLKVSEDKNMKNDHLGNATSEILFELENVKKIEKDMSIPHIDFISSSFYNKSSHTRICEAEEHKSPIITSTQPILGSHSRNSDSVSKQVSDKSKTILNDNKARYALAEKPNLSDVIRKKECGTQIPFKYCVPPSEEMTDQFFLQDDKQNAKIEPCFTNTDTDLLYTMLTNAMVRHHISSPPDVKGISDHCKAINANIESIKESVQKVLLKKAISGELGNEPRSKENHSLFTQHVLDSIDRVMDFAKKHQDMIVNNSHQNVNKKKPVMGAKALQLKTKKGKEKNSQFEPSQKIDLFDVLKEKTSRIMNIKIEPVTRSKKESASKNILQGIQLSLSQENYPPKQQLSRDVMNGKCDHHRAKITANTGSSLLDLSIYSPLHNGKTRPFKITCGNDNSHKYTLQVGEENNECCAPVIFRKVKEKKKKSFWQRFSKFLGNLCGKSKKEKENVEDFSDFKFELI